VPVLYVGRGIGGGIEKQSKKAKQKSKINANLKK
jgi:hypothetical protein